MTNLVTYPVIVTKHFPETVAFYEDTFDLTPCYETDGYARLCCPESKETLLVVIDVNHDYMPPNFHQEPTSQIMTFVTNRFEMLYDKIYLDGLTILKEPTELVDNMKHFMVADPNNQVVINVLTGTEQSAASGTVLHKLAS